MLPKVAVLRKQNCVFVKVLGVPDWLVGFRSAAPGGSLEKILHFAAEWCKFRKAASGGWAVHVRFVEGRPEDAFQSKRFA